jgi:hypothetical protein
MLRKNHGTNLFHLKFLGRTNIKCQNGPVLPSAQVFYFNSQALHQCIYVCIGCEFLLFIMCMYS